MPALLGAVFGSATSTGRATVSSLESTGRRSITAAGSGRDGTHGPASSPCSQPPKPKTTGSTFPNSSSCDSACPGHDSSPVNNQKPSAIPIVPWQLVQPPEQPDACGLGDASPSWCLIPLCPATKRRENGMFFCILFPPSPEMQGGDKKKGGRKGKIPVSRWSWGKYTYIYMYISQLPLTGVYFIEAMWE